MSLQYDFKIMSSHTNHNIKHFERVESHQSLFIIHNIKIFSRGDQRESNAYGKFDGLILSLFPKSRDLWIISKNLSIKYSE